MKNLIIAAILALAASATPALAQVYGTNDDPYQANPYASNMTLPDAPATAAPAAPATAAAPAAPAQPDASKTQQTAASSTAQTAAKKQAQP